MATGVYNKGKYLLMTGGMNLATGDIRCLLTTSAYTFDADHNFVSDITNECSGTGYVRKALAETVTEDDASDYAWFDATDVVWTGADFGTPARAIIYLHNAADASAALLACVDLTPAIPTNTGDYTVAWAATGILRLT